LVRDHTVLSVVAGSRAYGLATEDSDIDRRGVFVAPTPLFWGFAKPPSHVDGPDAERFSWELERFLGLALDANPTVLECLWSPLVEKVTEQGEELLALRGSFLSRHAHRTFLRYAEKPVPQAHRRPPHARRAAVEARHAPAPPADQRPASAEARRAAGGRGGPPGAAARRTAGRGAVGRSRRGASR
jgi:Predicted nucleotidyltransferase